ncbi:hypothetical protein V491_07769 [Pseudogymnoascus sp. VKM F-3775]|nr:hypothetical protein V491_07769 [Pseudogymnoascus sp. VKM F-3775]
MSITVLSNENPLGASSSASSVDIVAVHGLDEAKLDTWTDPRTNILWLRDLFPYKQLNVRVLAYGYEAENLSSSRDNTADRTLPYATTLIAALCAERELSNASERPIIFICHGFGGILVKRALAFSSRSRSKHVEHRRSIYVSTYGIIFMGTPHNGMSKEAIQAQGPWKNKITGLNQFQLGLRKQSEVLRDIADQFAPLMKNFSIYYFWEQTETSTAMGKIYIVDEHSAAPAQDNVDRSGIMATHSGMVKFSSSADTGYRVILATIRRFIKAGPEAIRLRWRNDEKLLAKERRAEAEALTVTQFLRRSSTIEAESSKLNEFYTAPRCSTNYFTGRRAYAKVLKERFANPFASLNRSGSDLFDGSRRSNQKIFVVHGLGGSGKTEFCLKYVEENRPAYWGVFWIDASSEENAESGFASLGLQAGKGPTFAAGMHWLSTCSKSWLLVIDNADDPYMEVTKYIPRSGNGHVLITTRNPGVIDYATVGNFQFRGMDPEEAIALLLRYAHLPKAADGLNIQSRKLAEDIASELGYLALALRHAGATIRRNIYTLDKYLHYYLGWRRTMIGSPQIKNADEGNIITTWEIPFRKIVARASESLGYKDAVDILHIFAFMHFESIPESIFQTFWNSINGTETDLADYPDILQNQSMLNEEAHARVRGAFRVLGDYSIIDHDVDRSVCSLHPVVHAWTRSRLDPVEYKRWLGCTTAILAHCISPHLEASGRKFRRELLPHIDSCLRALDVLFPSFPETTKQATEMDKFASVYAENGLWMQARALQLKVINLRMKKLGWRHEDTFQAKRNLGHIYWNLFQVEPCIEIQANIMRSRLFKRPSLADWMSWPLWKPDHIEYCTALSDITQSLWLAGKNNLSKRAGEHAVKGLLKHRGPDDPATLTAMFNLGRTLHHLRDYERSHRYLVHVLQKRKRFFGPDHPDTLMARNELGTSFRALGRMDIAERLIANVLEARKRTLGEEHAYTLWSVNEYSKILCDRGRSATAVSILEEIIPTVIRTLGEDHVGMSMTRGNLARAYSLNKRWDDAEGTLRRLTSTADPAHPHWIGLMCGYIHVRTKIGRIKETEDDCNKVLDVILKQKIILLDDPRSLGTAETLLEIYREQGRNDDILKLKSRVPGLMMDRGTRSSQFSLLYGADDDGRAPSQPRDVF